MQFYKEDEYIKLTAMDYERKLTKQEHNLLQLCNITTTPSYHISK